MNDACLSLVLRMRCWKHVCFNPGLVRLRHLDGCILSMEQSGTHWMRYLLGLAMSATYGKPQPETIQSPEFVGCIRDQPRYPELPQIISSHARPHLLMNSRAFCRHRHFPRYLLLVRDIRHVLVSHFEKWRQRNNVDFPTFLRGDPMGFRNRKDLWRQMEILNTWGSLIETGNVETHIVRYEQTCRDTPGTVASVCAYFHIPATPEICARAAADASKEQMAKRSKAPRNAVIVRRDSRHAFEWYSAEDRAFLQHACRRHLRYTFGYNYEDWSQDSPAQ